VMGDDHTSFTTAKIGSLLDVQSSKVGHGRYCSALMLQQNSVLTTETMLTDSVPSLSCY